MEYVDRRGTQCEKWDALPQKFGEDGLLAMWVADMDFACPACVKQALHEYIERPLGYFSPPASYFDAVVRWEAQCHGFAVQPEWVCVTPGVVPALYWAVRAFTRPGDGVMVSTPVYYPFMRAVEACEQRRLVKNELKRTGMHYTFDFEAMEQQIVQQGVTLYILCNPHNPVGRVWTQEELRRLLQICRRHGVLVVSDETEPYNLLKYYFTEVMASLRTDGYLIREDPSLKTFFNFFVGRDYLNSSWTDQLHQAKRIHIIYLAVDPSVQHHGIAAGLVEETIRYADENKLMISLETHNPKNVAFYQQFGFKVFGVLEKHFSLKQYCLIRDARQAKEK